MSKEIEEKKAKPEEKSELILWDWLKTKSKTLNLI